MKWISILLRDLSFVFAFCFSSLITVSVKAAERYEFYTGIRQMSMGGAAIGVVNDETALLSNPAGLGKLRDPFVTLVDPEITVSGEIGNQILQGTAFGSFTDGQGLIDTFAGSAENAAHLKFQLFPSLVLPNFGMGYLYNLAYNIAVDDTATNMELDYRQDSALVLAYNLKLFDGRIKLGFSGRYITRKESFNTLPTATTGFSFSTNETDGTGLGMDAGIILTAPWDMLPSLAVVLRDFGSTAYSIGGSSASDPNTTKQTMDAAFSLFPIHSNHVRSSITFEMRDIGNVEAETEAQRRYHFGWELNLADLFFFRAGYNQYYWTAGLEFATENMQLQFGTWGEEVGADGGSKIEDRRYAFKWVFRF